MTAMTPSPWMAEKKKVIAGEGYLRVKEELPELRVDDEPGVFFVIGDVMWDVEVCQFREGREG